MDTSPSLSRWPYSFYLGNEDEIGVIAKRIYSPVCVHGDWREKGEEKNDDTAPKSTTNVMRTNDDRSESDEIFGRFYIVFK